MLHIILATHAGLGKAMLETAAIISGGTEGVRTIELYPGQGAENVEDALQKELAAIKKGDQVLCLVDIPGGSPARVATGLTPETPDLHVVSGLNLGMLTEALLLKDSMDIVALKEHIMTVAAETIADLGELLQTSLSGGSKTDEKKVGGQI